MYFRLTGTRRTPIELALDFVKYCAIESIVGFCSVRRKSDSICNIVAGVFVSSRKESMRVTRCGCVVAYVQCRILSTTRDITN